MSSAALVSFISSPNSVTLNNHDRNYTLITAKSSCRIPPLKPPSVSNSFIKIPYGSYKNPFIFTPFNPVSPVMIWQDCTVKMEMDLPVSMAYKLYSDLEAVPNWMPLVSSVKTQGSVSHVIRNPLLIISVLEDKPDLSQWNVKYKAFGRKIEYSWLAKNLQPIPNQKIHWTSLEGLGNRGVIRFYPKGPSSCLVDLSISYEVPRLLIPVAFLLQPFMENLLKRSMNRFTKFAESSSSTR